eukprot:12329265-Prorocentrum_lima.AAC.1
MLRTPRSLCSALCAPPAAALPASSTAAGPGGEKGGIGFIGGARPPGASSTARRQVSLALSFNLVAGRPEGGPA